MASMSRGEREAPAPPRPSSRMSSEFDSAFESSWSQQTDEGEGESTSSMASRSSSTPHLLLPAAHPPQQQRTAIATSYHQPSSSTAAMRLGPATPLGTGAAAESPLVSITRQVQPRMLPVTPAWPQPSSSREELTYLMKRARGTTTADSALAGSETDHDIMRHKWSHMIDPKQPNLLGLPNLQPAGFISERELETESTSDEGGSSSTFTISSITEEELAELQMSSRLAFSDTAAGAGDDDDDDDDDMMISSALHLTQDLTSTPQELPRRFQQHSSRTSTARSSPSYYQSRGSGSAGPTLPSPAAAATTPPASQATAGHPPPAPGRAVPKRSASILQRLRKRREGSFKVMATDRPSINRKQLNKVRRSLSDRVTDHGKKSDTSDEACSISGPSLLRPIGRMVQVNSNRLHVVELHRPAGGRYGIFITEGVNGGVFISRFNSAKAEKLYCGLLNPGDEIIAINGGRIRGKSVDYVHNILAVSDKATLAILPMISRCDW